MPQAGLKGSAPPPPERTAEKGAQRVSKGLIMNDHYGSEDILTAVPSAGQREKGLHLEKQWPRRRFWPFQWGLAIHDFVMAYCGLWVSHQVAGLPFAGAGTVASYLMLAVLSFLVLSFFSVSQLYSYHLILFKREHRLALLRAIGWSALVFLLVAGYYALPMLRADHPTVSWVLLSAGFAGVVWVVIFYRQSLHYILRALGIGLIAVWVLQWIAHGQGFFVYQQTWSLPVGLFFSAVLVGAGRWFILTIVYNRWFRRLYRRQVGVIGSNQAAEEITSLVIEHNAPFWVAGTIGCDRRLDTPVIKDRLGDIVELPHIATANRLSDIVVTEEKMDKRTLISLLDFGMSNEITIWFSPALMPIIDKKIYIDNFCGIPMIKMCSQTRAVLFNRIKYALDAFIALPMFVALLPLFGVIALAIKINSRGPVFYRAPAIGKNGVEFKMFKFRSMRTDSDAGIHKEFVTRLIKGEIGKDGDSGKPLKITNDARVTAVGRILRAYSLDELPQLINVILGQMSLIGPRPCLPYEFDVYQDWYKKRAAIRPGVTGIWQVAGRSEVAFEEMILLDLYYLYNRNLSMDINLLIETALVVLKKKGAY